MFTLGLIIVLIAAVLLIAIVLIQPGKGDLTSTFGGLGGQLGSAFGMKRTTDILTKTTISLAVIILVVTLFLNKFVVGNSVEEASKPVIEGTSIPMQNTPAPAPAQLPEPAPAE
jgi:preprotein translocase subunit SecG